ncbi:MAG: hypothetical protein C0169_07930 [Thermodesulfobacterium geofontis]|uniref:Uncharacterized protein n=1 Tax=Thermodesulfobacterium geofontis TaxID=1295609 RepID=A0A2N7Q5F4_9BACT|nr:MAG: hypothetical protein C0169_07930 [Thermodesulfobacterium geofontis]
MIETKTLKQIEKKLEEDISKEIELIKNEIFFIIDKDLDIYFLKEFVKQYPRKLLKEKAEILLDTLLNYLMKEILEKIKSMHLDHQYEFFKENLRDKIRVKALSENGSFKPQLIKIKEEESLLDKTITAMPGIAVSAGGIIATVAIPETLSLKAIPAVSTLVGPIYVIKKLKDKHKRLKNLWKKQVNSYLKLAKDDLKKWLLDVEKIFLKDWESFYKKVSSSSLQSAMDKSDINYAKIKNI